MDDEETPPPFTGSTLPEVAASYPQSNQEAFDRAWNWFVVEKHEKALDHAVGVCVYRVGGAADSQVRCGVGCQIHDLDYDPRMEENGVQSLFDTFPFFVQRFQAVEMQLLRDIQQAHDAAELTGFGPVSPEPFLSVFERRMRDIAPRYNLTIPGERE